MKDVEDMVSLEDTEHREHLMICKIINMMNEHSGMALGKNFIIHNLHEDGSLKNEAEFEDIIRDRYFREVKYQGNIYFALNGQLPTDYLSWEEWKEVK